MIEKDLESDDQKTKISYYRDRISHLRFNFEKGEVEFHVTVNNAWIEIYTESHRVDAFRIPECIFDEMLSKTKKMKEWEQRKINREKRYEEHHRKMLDVLYGNKN